jgi:hypothetical protein
MIIRCGICNEVIPGDWPPFVAGICGKCRAEAYFTAERLEIDRRELMGEPQQPITEQIH